MRNNLFFECCVYVGIAIVLFTNQCNCCTVLNGMYDFSPLEGVFPVVDGAEYHYDISLCEPLKYESGTAKDACVNSSICLSSDKHSLNMGSYSVSPDVTKSPINKNWFTMYFNSGKSCNGKDPAKSTISFHCGPHLGYPVLIAYDNCSAYFTWQTLAACKTPPKAKQVRCYAVDENKYKIDLSPLIKSSGGYQVEDTDHGDEFFINVCSNISPDETTGKCPEGSSACSIRGENAVSYGSIVKGIKYIGGSVMLFYENGTKDNRCPDGRETAIIFVCPYRTKHMPPRIVVSSPCRYEVVWKTDYACPEHTLLTSSKECQFTDAQHGFNIDLNPLKNTKGFYNVSGNVNGTEQQFLFNVCSTLNSSLCPTNQTNLIAACMYDPQTKSSKVIGSYVKKELRYADSELILSYKASLESNPMGEVSTIINFFCSRDGDSLPQHVFSDNNTHLFEWKTIHACIKNETDIPCHTYKDGKIIDLSRLSKKPGEFWFMFHNLTFYLLGVCQTDVIGCRHGSSFCKKDDTFTLDNTPLNVGQFESAPYYDADIDATVLKYTNGDPCRNNVHWQALIFFICRPGHLFTSPVIRSINDAECTYEVEFHTAEACPLESSSGNDCMLYNADLGLSFDLSPLKEQTRELQVDNGTIYLSVCKPLKNSPCSQLDNGKNASVCFVKNSTKNLKPEVIGDASDTITYENGYLYLRYTYGKINTTIIFICNKGGENVSPWNTKATDGYYEFIWMTNLVCDPIKTVDCTVYDSQSNKLYDLSSLSRADMNWEVYENDSPFLKKTYINVCRSLVPQLNCSRDAAACVIDNQYGEETQYVSNAGSLIMGPQFVSEGHIKLQYSDGSPCNAFGESTNYSTVIQFVCPKPFVDQGPKYIGKVGNCEFAYIWSTRAACPAEDIVTQEKCYLTNPETGFIFDITPLSRNTKPYIVNAGNKTYHVNICGPVKGGCSEDEGTAKNGNIAVCEVNKKGKLLSTIASSDKYLLRYSKEAGLSLEYKLQSQDAVASSVISFPCSLQTSSGLKSLQKSGSKYLFEMKTPFTCEPKPFKCQFTDGHGHEYDLTSLIRPDNDTWDAVDNRYGFQHVRYHVSFCRPLSKWPASNCSGNVAVCQTGTESQEVQSLGSYYEPPTVSNEGVVSVIFKQGRKCPGTDDVTSSTHITLTCSHVQGTLIFMGETPDCEYLFSMNTPAACSLTISRGSDCTVMDSVYGHVFNLNALKGLSGNVVSGDFNYSLAVCRPLDNVTGECTGAAACQTKPSDSKFAKSLGLPSSELTYYDGVLSLVYESGSGLCHSKYYRSTNIKFVCDHNASLTNSVPFFVAEQSDCAYMFEWPTIYACPPFSTIDCSVEDDDGNLYDLTPLSLTKGNYYVKYKNLTFIINVCRNVIRTENVICPYTSAACLINGTSKRGWNIGEASHGPYFSNGNLRLRYSTGDRCTGKARFASMFMKTVIDFQCDRSRLHSEPQYVGVDDCTYYFVWNTAYACYWKEPVPTGSCTVSAPFTGFMFNLTSLQNDKSYKVENGNHRFHINVCGPVKDSPCGQPGTCQEEVGGAQRKWITGKPNADLKLHDNVLYLNYSDGDLCHNGLFRRSTIIQFVCGTGNSGPRFVHESNNCTYNFVWKTELACNPFVHCAVQNGSDHYDLSRLSKQHYVVKPMSYIDNATYYISVCDELGIIPNVDCPPDAAVCRVDKTGTAESLGKVGFPAFALEDYVNTIYTNGSKCSTGGNNNQTYKKSHIMFICDPNEQLGEPELITINEEYCSYIFKWKTNIVCPSKPVQPQPESCIYKDPAQGLYFDLSLARKNGSYYDVKDESDNGTYLLNICDNVRSSNLTNCLEAGACYQKTNSTSAENFGLSSSSQFYYDGQRLRLTLSEGDDCPSGNKGKKTSVIFFTCNPEIGIGHPTVKKKFSCMVAFVWETSLVCSNLEHECAFNIDGNVYDFYPLSSMTHNWEMKDDKGVKYWLSLCRGIQQNELTSGCPPSASVCMQDSDSSHMPLGLVNTMKIKKFNDSTLLLTYKSFSSLPCSKVNSSQVLNATARIFMICGKSLGSPKIVQGPDSSCFYDFAWETSLACADSGEEVQLDKNGFLFEKDLNYSMDLNPILQQSFNVSGTSGKDEYWYLINLSGLESSVRPSKDQCTNAAVCQTKGTGFKRDVGSFATSKFYRRGSELHLVLRSLESPCGRNKKRGVTTLINMECSTTENAIGEPKFLYESHGCDYIFEWGTYVVCSNFHRPDKNNSSSDKHQFINDGTAPHSSHKTAIVISLLFVACVSCYLIYLLSKAERRAAVASKFRSCFSAVAMPRFRYRRSYSNLNPPPSAIAYRSSTTNLLEVQFRMPSRSNSFEGKSLERAHGDMLTELQSDF